MLSEKAEKVAGKIYEHSRHYSEILTLWKKRCEMLERALKNLKDENRTETMDVLGAELIIAYGKSAIFSNEKKQMRN